MNSTHSDPLHPPRLRAGWYVACQSADLKAGQHRSFSFLNTPMVAFRGEDGTAGVLLNRCPHRNVPLSSGKVAGCTLQCGYHGWAFSTKGECVRVPGLPNHTIKANRQVAHFPIIEQQGFVWFWGDDSTDPAGKPFVFPFADDTTYLTIRQRLKAPGSLHAVAENALDVPHTAFLHGGLFRKDGDRKPITCVLKRWANKIECEYIGESRPEGLAGKLLSPSGGLVTHFDRFYLPGIVEVEYRIGTENHLILSAALTPAGDHKTIMYAVVSAKTRVPGFILRPVVQPLALHIFGQDVVILKAQHHTMEQFGESRFVSTDIDLVGPHIFKLLQRAAERGIPQDPGTPSERSTTLMV